MRERNTKVFLPDKRRYNHICMVWDLRADIQQNGEIFGPETQDKGSGELTSSEFWPCETGHADSEELNIHTLWMRYLGS